MKKIIAAHDLSGLGKASLGAVMPILSCMGSVVCPLPTAILSTITGVFEGYSIVGLTEQMKNTISHWKELGIGFDFIYSGFLGTPEQVDVIISAIDAFDRCYAVVDPVFADNGRLYPTMDGEMVENMKRLVSRANLITPNMTEACYLLGYDSYNDTPHSLSNKEAKAWLTRLCGMGPERAVITSCAMDDGIYVIAHDRVKNIFWKLRCDYSPVEFHGTGDIFTSVLTGALARGDSFPDAAALAANFVKSAIDVTVEYGGETRMGVLIEKVLDRLLKPCDVSLSGKCEKF